jgi:glycosyltransferase involved in cell wall biosynthesis
MSTNQLTVVINTLNEQAHIAECIQSVRPTATEVVVCDMYSDDDTVAIARELGAKIVYHERTGYVEPARNYAVEQANGDWILVLDADERLTPELRQEIQGILNSAVPESEVVNAYGIPRRNWMFGKYVEHGSWKYEAPVRLYRKGCVTWRDAIHQGPLVTGQVRNLKHSMLHLAHPTIERFLSKLNAYTEIEARQFFTRGVRIGLGRSVWGAARAFLGQYVRLQGFRDGGHGFILALLMSFYYFATRAKLWALWYQHDHNLDT